MIRGSVLGRVGGGNRGGNKSSPGRGKVVHGVANSTGSSWRSFCSPAGTKTGVSARRVGRIQRSHKRVSEDKTSALGRECIGATDSTERSSTKGFGSAHNGRASRGKLRWQRQAQSFENVWWQQVRVTGSVRGWEGLNRRDRCRPWTKVRVNEWGCWME